MGESVEDRAGMLVSLSTFDPHPESVPINALVPVEGTPMEEEKPVEIWEMVRMVATTTLTQTRFDAFQMVHLLSSPRHLTPSWSQN